MVLASVQQRGAVLDQLSCLPRQRQQPGVFLDRQFFFKAGDGSSRLRRAYT